MTLIDKLQDAKRPFLTDGGFETWLLFQRGFDLPQFAAIMLMNDDAARAAMREYFDEFLAMAQRAQTGFVLDTNTWRGCVEWAPALAISKEELLKLSADAVQFACSVRDDWSARVPDVVINGVVGPAGDGYQPGKVAGSDAAFAMHSPQIRALADAGVDMITAMTINTIGEATGIVRAARDIGVPVAISFTVETDGRLPTGDLLGAAIDAVDEATGEAAVYFMVNCAHPDHFRDTLAKGERWTRRIGGIRANASRLSHAELDESETLDQGNPEEFGQLHTELANRLPNLRVFGGCCGTDHRHVACASHHLHGEAVA